MGKLDTDGKSTVSPLAETESLESTSPNLPTPPTDSVVLSYV